MDFNETCGKCTMGIGLVGGLLVVVLVQAALLIACGFHLHKQFRANKRLNGLFQAEKKGNDDSDSKTQIAITGEEVQSLAAQQSNAQYNVLAHTVTIQEEFDTMYDVVHENSSKSIPLQPVNTFKMKDAPQAEYDSLHSFATKGHTAEQQQQPTPPSCEYAVINKSKISRKRNDTTPHEVNNTQYSVNKPKPKKKHRKGKKKESQDVALDAPPPIPPQMYVHEEELLPKQNQTQQTNGFGSADTLLMSKHEKFPYFSEAQYDVITH